jgi:DNA-binding YbaB/EbfC family protein
MDIKKLMQQAQNMQKKMQEMQEEIAKKEFEGKSGGGLVSIIMTGNGEMQKVNIDRSLMKEDEKEMLEDLIVAAYNEAKIKADEESKNNMSGALGDIGGLPRGFNF